ncbi:MAG: response regulator [Pseudomonadota bacterium]
MHDIDISDGLKPLNAASVPLPVEVLILDDDSFDRKRLERMVAKMGKEFHATGCASVDELTKELDHTATSVFLIDHMLGTDTGLDALNVIRQHPKSAHSPSIMISGQEDQQVIVDSIRAGCANFVSKNDLSVDSLRSKIYAAISETRARNNLNIQLNTTTDRILKVIEEGSDAALKPRLRNIYRQAGFIKECLMRGYLPSPEAVDEIEEEVLRIWQFTDRLKDYHEAQKTLHT